MNRLFATASILALGMVSIMSCSTGQAPTGSTSLDDGSVSSGSVSTNSSSFNSLGPPPVLNNNEDFNCTAVQDVHVRFGAPGWVRDNVVALFVEYFGVPDVKPTLRIWWDFENNPESFKDIPFEDGDIRRNDDLIDIEKIVEHTYSGLQGQTRKRARAELILADQTGNCARVRDVTVAPAKATIRCPSPSIEAAGYCWIKQINASEIAAAACARIDKTRTRRQVPITWDTALMREVTGKLGCTNLGVTGCCSPSLWYDPGSDSCFTYRFDSFYQNYGYLGTSAGVYLCKP